MAKETAKKKEKISIIVPCFNEEEALPLFYDEITKVMKSIRVDYELLLVNDGSKDNTMEVMKRLSKKDKHVLYLSFSRNFGKESAMYAGFVNATGDYVAVMDADMQDPPSLLPEMVRILKTEDYDSVATRRKTREGESKVRSFFARAFYRIINKISDSDIIDGARDFRLMKRPMVDAILSMTEYNRFSKGIFGWVGFKTYWLAYENVERVAGTTSWSFWGLFKYAISGFVNFSLAPLNIATFIGFASTGMSFIYLVFVLIKYLLFGDPVQGWATLICVILFLGGIQLLCIGIIGQYVGKTYLEVKNRPRYIVSETNKKDIISIK